VKADHFEQQKLLELAAEDVALTQLAHRRRTLPEVAAVEAAVEAERTFAADVVRAQTEVNDLGREVKRMEADVETVRQREAKDQRLLDSGSVSPKEMTNLQHELDSLKRRQSDLEDQELELMERLEEAEATLAEARQCQGCRIELYGNELAAVRNADPHEVVRCENCGRILVRTAESGL
jgi:predicted  nucleic acid-binding Zn-ribbon protein